MRITLAKHFTNGQPDSFDFFLKESADLLDSRG
jgi:hypothetical protein